MKIVRVFAGDDGESHFEEVPFAEMQGMVGPCRPRRHQRQSSRGPQLLRLPPGPKAAVRRQPGGHRRVRVRRRLQGAARAGRHPGGGGPQRPRPHCPILLRRHAHLPRHPLGRTGLGSSTTPDADRGGPETRLYVNLFSSFLSSPAASQQRRQVQQALLTPGTVHLGPPFLRQQLLRHLPHDLVFL